MAELRFQWGDEEVQDSPAPPRATSVSVVAAERIVWQGDVTPELRAWARWCALQVVHLWDCPPEVRTYLRTGDSSLRQAAQALASSEAQLQGDIAFDRLIPDNDAQVAASWAAHDAAAREPAGEVAAQAHEAIAWAADPASGRPVEEVERVQAAHLRTLLLRRALPENRWPLIDGDDRVLCDALLELR